MTTFTFLLEVRVQADDAQEAEELQAGVVGRLAADPEDCVLAVGAWPPREREPANA